MPFVQRSRRPSSPAASARTVWSAALRPNTRVSRRPSRCWRGRIASESSSTALCDRGEIVAELIADDAADQGGGTRAAVAPVEGSAREEVQEEALTSTSRPVAVVSRSRVTAGLAGVSECRFIVIAEGYNEGERTPENL